MPFRAEYYQQHHSDLIKRYCQSRNVLFEQCTYLAQGANNVLYHTIIDKQKCVCKIGVNPSFRRLSAEYRIICKYGFCPGLIDFFTDQHTGSELLVMPYIHGTHIASLSSEQIEALGNAIASYHHPVRSIPGIEVENMAHFCANRILPVTATDNNAAYCARFRKLLDTMQQLAGETSAIALHGGTVLVHGDLIPENIFFTADGTVRFIDWEGARYDSPETDLATCIKGFNFTESETDRLLNSYGRPVNRQMLSLRMVLHYLQVAAWRLAVQLNIETDNVLFDKAAGELEQELDFIKAAIATMG